MSSSTLNISKRRHLRTNINDYFFPSTYQHEAAYAISPSGLLSPSLPTEVQASLLQVGMRIRKSVPEGYKNQDTTAAKTTSKARSPPPAFFTAGSTTTATSSAHLTPYCGIHKVGGFQYQLHADDVYDDSDSIFTSSQDSTTSAMAPPTSKKRNLSAASDDLHHQINTFRASLSPALRPIAQAKTRMRRSPTMNAWGGREYDVMEWDDFEEAQFLKPLEESKRGPRFAL